MKIRLIGLCLFLIPALMSADHVVPRNFSLPPMQELETLTRPLRKHVEHSVTDIKLYFTKMVRVSSPEQKASESH